MLNYQAAFPLSVELTPPTLRRLLAPVGLSSSERVEVAARQQTDQHGDNAEELHLLMAVAPGADAEPIAALDEAGSGLVESSVPAGDRLGCYADFVPSISGYDYIVAAWGDSSFYTYNLAEKVWMTLGLSPRCVGNEGQRLIYDDLSTPEFEVADGEISSEFQWNLKRGVCWRMSNEYLRRYLWLRGARGVRVFYYSAQLHDSLGLRALMGGETHVQLHPEEGVRWYTLAIQEHRGGLLLEVWASVEAVLPELCPEQTAEGILWPGDLEPMTYARANALIAETLVHLDDRFLERYEQNAFYNSTPVIAHGIYSCSPSYKGQWSFTDCRRVGRNVVVVPMRELYKPKPDREILHAHLWVIDPAALGHIDMQEEHIVSKVQRLLAVLLRLGESLSALGQTMGFERTVVSLIGFDPQKIRANGWLSYPQLARLAQVAPLAMTQQDFLSRCKRLHEIWQAIPDGFLKNLLECAGCPRPAIKGLEGIKLMQALFNVTELLNRQEERVDAFPSVEERDGWINRNGALAALFLNNDLRVADAHEVFGRCLMTLQALGFDTADVTTGYGRALDFVMDGVIDALGMVADSLGALLRR